MKKALLIFLFSIIIIGFGTWWRFDSQKTLIITNFEECVANGNPVEESYPSKCRHGDNVFVENIGNELEKTNLIRLANPRPNQVIKSPFVIKGEARGYWFFEASFPIDLVNWDGLIIASGFATAQGEWMTEDFVPFETNLSFDLEKDLYSKKGTLILHKNNASGLSEHDDALEIPVIFE